MKILLTGSSGKIGSVFALKIESKAFCPLRKDLDLSEPVNAKVLDSIDGVIYAAGINGRKVLDFEHSVTRAVNTENPALLAGFAAEKDIPFLYLSSDDVFDGEKGAAYVESDRKNPLNRYGEEKSEAEDLILKANKEAKIIRYPLVFGYDNAFPERAQFVDHLIDQTRQGLAEFSLSTKTVTSPSFVSDLVEKSLDIFFDKEASGIFHVFNEGKASFFDFGQYLRFKFCSDTRLSAENSTFSDPDFSKKGYAPMHSERIPPLRSFYKALDYFEKGIT